MRRLLTILFIVQAISILNVYPQSDITLEEYIRTYRDTAIEEMRKHHIPASITLAQGILESGCGNSQLARTANNHFGIKCHNEWTGKTFHMDDDEKDECFRRYKDPIESYRDHSMFLVSRDRYKFLFDLDITDYKSWAYGLKKAGYATNPKYPEMLIRIIEENGLDKLDQGKGHQLAAGDQRAPDAKLESPEVTNAPGTFEISGRGGNDRVIFLNNGVKFILARQGDDFYKIAQEFKIYTWQIRKYNEMKKSDNLQPGQKVYLEPKKGASQYEFHEVNEGETLESVSQDFGIKMRSLCRKNGLKPGQELESGRILKIK